MSAISGLPPKLRAEIAEAERRLRANSPKKLDGSTDLGDALRSGTAIAAVTVLLVMLWLAASGCASAPPPVVAPAPVRTATAPDCPDLVDTSTPAPDAACSTVREAWRLQRRNAVRWKGIAAKRLVRIGALESDLRSTRDALNASHALLVSSPPPASDRGPSALVRALQGAVLVGGAALGGAGAAGGCALAGCPTWPAVGVTAGGAIGGGVVAAIVLWLGGGG